VQPFEGDEEQRQKVKHTRTCASLARHGKVQWEDVYLYREMTSEALRILLPVSTTLVEEKLDTFAATLSLGLRLHLGGDPDHLAIWPHTEMGRDGVERRYLMLFDRVPGGTSYLKELAKPDTFRQVLQLARDALASCPCRLKPGKKACYRCLYSYRHGNHDLLSRQLGLEMVQRILDNWPDVQRAETLSDISMENVLESELEQRFIDALIEWAAGKRDVTLQSIPIRGKQGWQLTINGQEWIIEPQAPLGFEQGITHPSRPDFLFRPRQLHASAPRPIALFADGFAYHAMPHHPHARIGDDLTKRQAIIDSGRYWVWTITWNDVEAFAEKTPSIPLLDASQRRLLQKIDPHSPFAWHQGNGLEQLLTFLASPDISAARKHAGAIAALLLEHRPPVDAEVLEKRRQALLTELDPPPLDIPDDASGDHLYGIHQQRHLHLLVDIPAQALRPPKPDDFAVALRLDDSAQARASEEFLTAWQRFWLYVNVFQFLPRFAAATTEQIAEKLRTQPVVAEPALQPAVPVADLTGPWQEAFDFADEACVPLLEAVHSAGLPAPVVGYELTDTLGRVVAQSELAWPDQRVAVLLPDAADDREAFLNQAWRIFLCDDALQSILQALSSHPEVT
jgi:DEAD/DEAH box helicase domain-containing protein